MNFWCWNYPRLSLLWKLPNTACSWLAIPSLSSNLRHACHPGEMEFNPRSVRVRFVVEKLALRRAFYQVLWFSQDTIFCNDTSYSITCLPQTLYNLSNWKHPSITYRHGDLARPEHHYSTKFPSNLVNLGLRFLFFCDIAQRVLVVANSLFGRANCPIFFVSLLLCVNFSSSFCPAPAFSSIFLSFLLLSYLLFLFLFFYFLPNLYSTFSYNTYSSHSSLFLLQIVNFWYQLNLTDIILIFKV